MIEIATKDIEKSYSVEKILDKVTIEVQNGDRIGLIGKNGCGKTTLFKIIAGIENYDSGNLMIRKDLSIGYLDQIPEYPNNYKVSDVLNNAFDEIFMLQKEMNRIEKEMSQSPDKDISALVKKYGDLQLSFEHKEGYSIIEKSNKICTGLKIDDKLKERLFSTLSGGEKTTVVIAKILLENPDVLLLDEPTNHLDIESVEWLESFLKNYEGSVLIISHDRYFLDKVVSKIYEIENKKINTYYGNYSYYVDEKKRIFDEQLKQFKNQEKKIKSMEHAIKRFKDWGTRSDDPRMFKKASNMQKRIDKMEKIENPKGSKKIKLKFSSSSRSASEVIVVRDVSKSFNEKVILDNINININYGENVAIIGKNGSGKTTLIKMLLNVYEPDKGDVKIGSRTKIGYLEQVINFDNNDISILDYFRDRYQMPERQARTILSKFLFFGEDVFKKVGDLSGGEKVRLKLCNIMQDDVNLLILDEPTNHLDIDSREVLESSLSEFIGTLVFISHDRYFLNKFAEKILEIVDKKLKIYYGNYDYYKLKKEEKNLMNNDNFKIKSNNYKNTKVNSEKSKNMIKRIESLEEDIKIIEKQILDKDIEIEEYSSDYDKLNDKLIEKQKLIDERDLLLEEWIKLQ